MKDSGWRIDKIKAMKMSFHKNSETNGSKYVKNLLRASPILKIENGDENCFHWSILVSKRPCQKNHPNEVSIFGQDFDEWIIQDFVFSDDFKIRDVHKIEKSNTLSINMFE